MRGFLLGILCSILMGINLVIAYSGFAQIYFMLFAVITFMLLITNSRDMIPIVLLFFILGFPEYGPNPYSEQFYSPFYYQKYVIALFCISVFFVNIKLDSIIYFILLAITWSSSFLYEINGAFLNELFQLFILISLLAMNHSDISRNLIKCFLLSFIAFSFIGSLIVDLFGYSQLRQNGGEVFFFGHWFGILIGYFILNIAKTDYSFSQRLMLLLFFGISLFININSLQSAHVIFIILCICIALRLFAEINLRSISILTAITFFIILLTVSNLNTVGLSGDYAWTQMKLIQTVNVFNFDTLNIANSPLIRINEFLSLYEQSNLSQILFGRGYASTYSISGAFWHLSLLHEATFPIDQINSGRLQMVHETLVLLFKWTGIVGIIAVFFIYIRKLRLIGLATKDIQFNVLLVVFFLLSGVHTGLLCLMLISYGHDRSK
jgi:hypothetical protein